MNTMILWVGKRRLQGDLSKIIEAHEENSFIDSGLRKKEWRDESYVKHWKGGWIEELERKIRSREIEIINEGEKVEIRTTNKFLMAHAREHIEAIKGAKGDMCKISTVRNNEKVFLTYELLGMRGVQLENCGINN